MFLQINIIFQIKILLHIKIIFKAKNFFTQIKNVFKHKGEIEELYIFFQSK